MDGSLYPTKVEVRRADLINTETTKAFHTVQRFLATSQPGVVQGLTVQASAIGVQRYDILAGFGFTPRGDFVELTQTLEGQAPEAVAGIPVLIGLMYREVAQREGAAETDGIARAREVVRSSELLTFDQAAYESLPESFDTDLSVNARDRFLICGVAEVPGQNTDPLDIELPPSFDIIKSIPNPTNLTGIFVVGLDVTTLDSDPAPALGNPDNALLRFDPSALELAYKAPQDNVDLAQAAPFDDVGLGVPVDVSAGGPFTLTSANGTNTVTVEVDPALLPTTSVGASIQDALSVTTLYTPNAARNTSKDDLHRHQLGSQVPRSTNPHGVRFSDIQSLMEDIIGTLRIGTNYTTSVALGDIPRMYVPPNLNVDSSTDYRVFQIADSPGVIGANSSGKFNDVPLGCRVYKTSFDSLVFTLNCRIRNEGTNATIERLAVNGDDPDSAAAMIEFSPFAIVTYAHDAGSSDTWDSTSWDRVQLFHSFVSNRTTYLGSVHAQGDNGEAPVRLGELILDTADKLQIARAEKFYQDDSGVGIRSLMDADLPPAGGVGGSVRTRIYRSNSTSGPLSATRGWEVVWNAVWDNTGAAWTQEDNTYMSWRLMVNSGGLELNGKNAGQVGTFSDANWSSVLKLDGNGLHLGSASDVLFDISSPKTQRKIIMGKIGIVARSSSAGTPTAFDGRDSSTFGGSIDPTTHSFEGLITAGASQTGDAWWPLELPHNAVVTGVRVRGQFDNSGGILRAAVARVNTTTGVTETMKSGTSYNELDNGGTEGYLSLTIDQNSTIDNNNNAYYIWFGRGTSGVAHVKWWEITYTVPQLSWPL